MQVATPLAGDGHLTHFTPQAAAVEQFAFSSWRPTPASTCCNLISAEVCSSTKCQCTKQLTLVLGKRTDPLSTPIGAIPLGHQSLAALTGSLLPCCNVRHRLTADVLCPEALAGRRGRINTMGLPDCFHAPGASATCSRVFSAGCQLLQRGWLLTWCVPKLPSSS
jgi:hypothetical protein